MRNRATNFEGKEVSPSTVDCRRQWFAAYTISRHEKHTHELLTERGVENFLPLYRTSRRWANSSPVILDLPLFPTYVFVRIARAERGTVLGTPGVVSIVGSHNKPWPLPDSEIATLQLGVHTHKFEPHDYLRFGERVRIKTGVMAGIEGVLVRKKNEYRVVLTLDAIMRSVAVEVDLDDIEAASSVAVCAKQTDLPAASAFVASQL